MHGNNLNSLHQLLHPEILPSELGGMMPPYDMGTWARTLLDHAYDEDTDYCPESYTLSVQDLERDLEKNLSPKTMKRSVSPLTRQFLRRPPGGARIQNDHLTQPNVQTKKGRSLFHSSGLPPGGSKKASAKNKKRSQGLQNSSDVLFLSFRSQSVVEPGVLKRPDKVKSEEDNMQPLLSLD